MDNPTDINALVHHFTKAKINNQKGRPNIRALCPLNHETKVASFDCWITEEGVVCGKCYSCDDKEGIKKYFKELGYNSGSRSNYSKPAAPQVVKPAPRIEVDGYLQLTYLPPQDKFKWNELVKAMQIKHPGSKLYKYSGTDDKDYALVVRTEAKHFLPYTFFEHHQTGLIKWFNKDPKPLYVKPGLYNRKDVDTLHVYEGEKTTDAGCELYKDKPNIIHCCWGFGASSYDKADWNSLKKFEGIEEIILFPDNDKPGHEAMMHLSKRLFELGYSKVSWVNFESFPQKWDVADICTQEQVENIKELYENREELVETELDNPIEYAYIKKIDQYICYEFGNLYPPAHFNRVLSIPPGFTVNGKIIKDHKDLQ